ncbi:aspartic peptidase domain-containing protein [Melampsora americana]|nr:aspartic peptidase domain-containing protein [Melampsora americana]
MFDTRFGWQIYLASCALVSQRIEAISVVSIPLTNAIDLFTIALGVGEPSRVHHVGIDTGSFVTYAGGITPYIATKTTVDLQVPLRIDYAVGYAEGAYVNDTLLFESVDGNIGLQMQQVVVGKISKLTGFDGFDGLIGLNHPPLNEPSSFMNTPLTAFMWKRDLLKRNIFAISSKPTRSKTPETNGLLTFGGINKSLFIGQIYWYQCRTGSWWDWTVTISYGKRR